MLLYSPLKYFLIYIVVTVLISFYGPIEYYGFNKVIVAVFMSAFLFLFVLGYLVGVPLAIKKKISNQLCQNTQSNIQQRRILNLIKISILVTVILALWSFISYLSKYGFTIQNLGEAYISAYAGIERNVGRSYSILELLTMFSGVFTQIAIILGVFYFKKLSNKWKIMLLTGISLTVLTSLILNGKMQVVGEILIYLLSVLIVVSTSKKVKINRKKIVLLILIGIIIFTLIQKLRFEAIGVNLDNYNSAVTYHISMNKENIIFKIFGEEWGFPLAVFMTAYLSGGYYGLSLCLSLPFQWTYGFGHSYSLSVLANRFIGLPFFFEDNYVVRMESQYGWPAMSKWHTIFPHFASDLTFIGTLILFFFIALIYAISYVEAVKYRNPISLLLFASLNIMLVFVPANNQLMIGPEGYFAFLIIFWYWFFFHKRYNFY